MALFQSGNPTLSQKIFDRSVNAASSETMTVRGTINKFGFLMIMLLVGAAYTWYLYQDFNKEGTMVTLMWVGLIGGLILSLVISFKPNLSPYLAPAYAILEGFAIGAISAVLNNVFSEKKYPGIVMQAVAITFGVALTVFALYNFGIIKATQKFKAIMMTAIIGIFVFYMIWMILGLFHVQLSFMNWDDASPLGIGINIFVAVIAALSLVLDFDRIEKGAESGAPKYMEWYGGFGLLVTMVWLYIEILKLLSRFASRK